MSDARDKLISIVQSRVEASKSEGVERFVAGAAILQNDRILLIQRRMDDFMPGIFELPSGASEEGESLLETLGREITEETGLKLAAIRSTLGAFDYFSRSGKLTRQFNFLVETAPGEISLSEHVAYLWANAKELNDIKLTESTRNVIEEAFSSL